MITRIRNASLVHHNEVVVDFSKMKLAVAKVLKEEGFIADVKNLKKSEVSPQGHLVVTLKYTPEGKSVLHHIRRMSKPGQRYYTPSEKLPRVMNGLGVSIISTSKGIMADRDARKARVGGEVLCAVW